MLPQHVLVLYLIVPLWLAAGFADWLCHRRSALEATSGAPESALHLLMLGEMGLPLLAAIYLDVNALILGALLVMFLVHELTAYIDVRYAAPRRHVSVFEQFVHSVLEMSPLMVIVLLASAHWSQWLALFGFGDESARFALRASTQAPPLGYTIGFVIALVALAVVPYVEEFVRAWRTKRSLRTDAPA